MTCKDYRLCIIYPVLEVRKCLAISNLAPYNLEWLYEIETHEVVNLYRLSGYIKHTTTTYHVVYG
jgi:hypothetical protein